MKFLPLLLITCFAFSCQFTPPVGHTTILLEVQTASIEPLKQVLLTRLDEFGIPANRVEMSFVADRLTIDLQGTYDTTRLAHLLTATGAMEFWETYPVQESFPYITEANSYLGTQQENQKKQDTTSWALEDEIAHFKRVNPLFAVLSPPSENISPSSPIVGYAKAEDIETVNQYVAEIVGQKMLPEDMVLAWKQAPVEGVEEEVYELIALKKIPSHLTPLTERDIKLIIPDFDLQEQPVITIHLNQEGTQTFSNMTEANVGKAIAIVIDGRVVMAPVVQEPIRKGDIMISGDFTYEETKDLSIILSKGRLPVDVALVGLDSFNQ